MSYSCRDIFQNCLNHRVQHAPSAYEYGTRRCVRDFQNCMSPNPLLLSGGGGGRRKLYPLTHLTYPHFLIPPFTILDQNQKTMLSAKNKRKSTKKKHPKKTVGK